MPTTIGYSTTFSGPNEYPLSDGGNWFHNTENDIRSFNRMELYNGFTNQVIGYDGQPGSWGYYDGVSHLSGFPPDQWIEGTMYIEPGFDPGAENGGTLALRVMTFPISGAGSKTHVYGGETRATTVQSYGFGYYIYDPPPNYGGSFNIGFFDGNAVELNDSGPNTDHFYGSFGGHLTSPAECTGGLRNNDMMRFTVQGANPVFNAYVKRVGGSWVHCNPTNYQPDTVVPPVFGPPWHTAPFTTGNPGITQYQQNSTVRHMGWTAINAGVCPAWPASCAP